MLARTVAVIALALTPRLVDAQSDRPILSRLEGIKAVHLRIGLTTTAAETRSAFTDTAGLRLQTEAQLTRAGLVVSDTATTELWIRATVWAPATDLFAVVPSLDLIDEVTLTHRAAAGPFRAFIYHRHTAAFSARSNLPSTLMTAVRNHITIFLQDYLAANPPRR